MVRDWKYHVKGTAAGGQCWEFSGTVHSPLHEIMDRVMVQSFHALTHGKAIYGHPGVGCKGPYEIKSLTVEQIDVSETYLR